MKRRLRIRWLLPVVAAVALLITWNWYATRPTLVWRTSPPLDSKGRAARFLVPIKWELSYRQGHVLMWTPSESNMPRWLRWLWRSWHDEPAGVSIHADTPVQMTYDEGVERVY